MIFLRIHQTRTGLAISRVADHLFQVAGRILFCFNYCMQRPEGLAGGGGGGEGSLPKFWVGMCPGRTKKYTHNLGKIFIEKSPKTYKNDMNLLLFFDLTYNLCKSLKFYYLQILPTPRQFLVLYKICQESSNNVLWH